MRGSIPYNVITNLKNTNTQLLVRIPDGILSVPFFENVLAF